MPMIGTIGSPVIIDTDVPFAIKNVALIKFASSSMKPEYIQQILSSSYFFKMVDEANRGSNRKFVSLGDLRKMKILLAPEPLQKEFAAKVEEIVNQKKQIQSHIAQLQTSKKEIIDNHFR